MNVDVRRTIRSLRRRYRRVVALDLFLEISFFLAATLAVLLLADRLAYEFRIADLHVATAGQILALFGGCLAGAAVAAPLLAGLRRIGEPGIAWRADKILAAPDVLLTSLEFEGSGSPFAPLLARQAEAAAAEARPERIFPARAVGYRWGIVLPFLAGVVLAVVPPQGIVAPRAGLLAAPLRGLAPLRIVCEDLSEGPVSKRTWDFGDGTRREGGLRVEHTFAEPGRYTVRQEVEGPGGSDRMDPGLLIEVLEPTHPLADFSAAPRKGRAPLEVKFRNLSRNCAAFQWTFGDGEESADSDPVHRYEKAGLYTVTLIGKSAEGREDRVERKAWIRVVAPDGPLADFFASPRKGTDPLDVQFEDASLGTIGEWEWDFGDRLAGESRTSRLRNPLHTYLFPGGYTVKLTVRGPNGEDVEVKERFIVVGDPGPGESGGGGGQRNRPRTPESPKGGPAEPSSSDLFGALLVRPKVEFKDTPVPQQPRGEDLVEKLMNVPPMPGSGEGEGSGEPFREAYGEIRRAAEDAMERDQVPASYREYVKRYFDRLRPR